MPALSHLVYGNTNSNSNNNNSRAIVSVQSPQSKRTWAPFGCQSCPRRVFLFFSRRILVSRPQDALHLLPQEPGEVILGWREGATARPGHAGIRVTVSGRFHWEVKLKAIPEKLQARLSYLTCSSTFIEGGGSSFHIQWKSLEQAVESFQGQITHYESLCTWVLFKLNFLLSGLPWKNYILFHYDSECSAS